MERKKTCCFTGHRPQGLGFPPGSAEETDLKNRLSGAILRLIDQEGVRHFISGMALGVDTWAAQRVLALREVFPDVTLECAVPCRTQTRNWREWDVAAYREILEKADRVTVLQEQYTSGCMQRRNEYMVDGSDLVLAVWNGGSGGTANTVHYARRRNKPVLILPPIKKEEGVD